MLSTLIKGWAAMKVYDVARGYLGNRSAPSDRPAPSAQKDPRIR